MTFGEKIHLLRKQNSLTQEQLAERLTITRQTVSKWELGESEPDVTYLIQLSEIFQVTTDYLLKDVPNTTLSVDSPSEKEQALQKKVKIWKCGFFILLGVVVLIIGVLIFVFLKPCNPSEENSISREQSLSENPYLISVLAEWLVEVIIDNVEGVQDAGVTVQLITEPAYAIVELVIKDGYELTDEDIHTIKSIVSSSHIKLGDELVIINEENVYFAIIDGAFHEVVRVDLPDGFHIYNFECGCTYEGYWENGLPNGLGKYTTPMNTPTEEGVAILEGNFVDGIAHGMVTYTRIWPDRTWIFEFEADMGWQIEDSVVNAEGIGLPARFPLVVHLVMDYYLATNENWQRYDYLSLPEPPPFTTISIPDMVNTSLNELLADERYIIFTFDIMEEHSDDVPEGYVISQSPRANTSVMLPPTGEKIRIHLVVSVGLE